MTKKQNKRCSCEICRAYFSIRVWKRLHQAGYRTLAKVRSDIAQDCRVLLKLPGFGTGSWIEFLDEDARIREYGLRELEDSIRRLVEEEALLPSVRAVIERMNVNEK